MTTGEGGSLQAAPACEYNPKKCRRKAKRACCCLTFLLIINAFLLLHTAHSIGAITWFTMHGSYTYKDTTYLFMPGGAKAMCNDVCVDVCIYRGVGCEINHCLNVCNEQLIDDGNEDDFEQLPEFEIIETDPGVWDEDVQIEPLPPVSYEDGITGNEALDELREAILVIVDKINGAKAKYHEMCDEDPNAFGCDAQNKAIKGLIAGLQISVEKYDDYAVSVEIDITVAVWLVDIDDIETEP